MSKITIDRKVLKQALYALDAACEYPTPFLTQINDAMKELREALARPQQEPVSISTIYAAQYNDCIYEGGYETLSLHATPQAAQDAVVEHHNIEKAKFTEWTSSAIADGADPDSYKWDEYTGGGNQRWRVYEYQIQSYATDEIKQEPVAYLRHDGNHVTPAFTRSAYPDFERRFPTPLYTSPQAQQPLTKAQRLDVFVKAEAAMGRDQNLSWRDALINETEQAHGIAKGAA